MTRDEWLQIIGLITNIQTRRFKLTRNGKEVELTIQEEEAMAKFRKAWAGGGIEWTS